MASPFYKTGQSASPLFTHVPGHLDKKQNSDNTSAPETSFGFVEGANPKVNSNYKLKPVGSGIGKSIKSKAEKTSSKTRETVKAAPIVVGSVEGIYESAYLQNKPTTNQKDASEEEFNKGNKKGGYLAPSPQTQGSKSTNSKTSSTDTNYSKNPDKYLTFNKNNK